MGSITIGNKTARNSVVPVSNETLLSKLTNVMLQCVWSSPNTDPVVKNITGTTWTNQYTINSSGYAIPN
jgi:hypothetical protein